MKLSLRDKAILYHELAKLVKSGFGMERSVDLIAEQAPNRPQTRFARETLRRLQSGQTIAEAIDQPELGITALDPSLLHATEQGGVLEVGLAYLRDHYQGMRERRQSIAARLLYPAILLHLAAFLPVIPSLLLGEAISAELTTSILTLIAFYALAALLASTWRTLDRMSASSVPVDRILRRLPLLGKARRLMAWQRFAEVFRVSLLSSLRFSDGLNAAGRASRSAVLGDAAARLSRRAAEGGNLGALLPNLPAFPPDFARSLANAELAGNLEEDLLAWSRSFRESLDAQMTRVGTVLPMLFTALVAVYVAWRILSLYAGLMNDRLQQFEQYW